MPSEEVGRRGEGGSSQVSGLPDDMTFPDQINLKFEKKKVFV
jgi:hypothetical protein